MKKLGIIMMLALSSLSIKAEDDGVRDHIQYGFKIGANMSNVYSVSGQSFIADPKFGLAVGGFTSIPLGKLFAFHPEILFSQKGFNATGVLLGNPYTISNRLNYLDIPLMGEFRPADFLNILLGVQYSYLLSQKYSFDNGPTNVEQITLFKNENINRNTFSITGGADVNLMNIVLGVRLAWDMTSHNGDGTSVTPNYKNVWYQATIGYRFIHNHKQKSPKK